jgi:predicted O-methyltransferase YrrM
MSDSFVGSNIPDEIQNYTKVFGPDKDGVLDEMEAKAQEEGFPIVGENIGSWLSQLVHLSGAERVFEFGSGFGYSAYWIARSLPKDGEIILTDYKRENIADAKKFFEDGGIQNKAVFECGDAIEVAEEVDGGFDIVLIDMEKHNYAKAFDLIKDHLNEGGIIVADDAISASRHELNDLIDFEILYQIFVEDADLGDFDLTELKRENMPGIVEFINKIKDDPNFETTLLPLGEGLSVSVKKK